MSDRERLDRYLDDFGGRLAGAPPARRRPRRIIVAICGAAMTAVLAALVLSASGERLDPVAEARAALAPAGDIVYMKITSKHHSPTANSVPPPRTAELWSARDPLRWRFVETIPRPSRRAGGMADASGPIFGRSELSYGEGEQRAYLAERDVLTVTTGYGDGSSAARIPSLLGAGAGDPQSDLRAMLADGKVTDEGERQVGGRTIRRFVSVRRRDAANDPAIVWRLVYDVDPDTFAPLEGRISLRFPGREPAPRITTVMHVDAYERIPLDATTAKLLEIRTTPRTRVVTRTARQLRERAARWRARCRPLHNGNLACPAPAAPRRTP